MKLAYLIKEIDNEDTANIEFHTSGEIKNLKRSEEYHIERSPIYDEYAHLGYVPPEVLLNNGWWLSCYECEKQIYSDRWDYEEDKPMNVVIKNNSIFCCQSCHDRYHARIQRIRKLKQEASEFVTKNYPELSRLSLYTTGTVDANGNEEIVAEFYLPGFKYRCSWKSTKPDTVTYCKGDEELAQEYFKKHSLV